MEIIEIEKGSARSTSYKNAKEQAFFAQIWDFAKQNHGGQCEKQF